MDKTTLSILSALIGALSAIGVIALKTRAERDLEYRKTQREKLAPILEEIGEALYQIVSSVVLLSVDEDDATYYKQLVSKNSALLRILRPKVRYQLWGLDEGFRAHLLLPGIVKSNERISHRDLFNKAISLRKILDISIKNCHLHGRPPNLWERCLVSFWVWRIKKEMDRL